MRQPTEIRADLIRCAAGKPCSGCAFEKKIDCKKQLMLEAATALPKPKHGRNSKLYFITCRSCGSGYYDKVDAGLPVTTCKCGETMEIHDELLLSASFTCSCGKRWDFLTNFNAPKLYSRCADCGATVTSRWNKRLKKFTPEA